MITALLVDDEPPARDRLRRLLGEHPDVQVVGEAGDAATGRAMVAELDPGVIFLDISLPDQDGFSVAASTSPTRTGGPALVFVTAHADHALRAWDLEAVDYLLKPFHSERLAVTLDRVRRHLGAAASQQSPLRRLPVEANGRVRFLDVGAIETVRAERNYVQIRAQDRNHLVRSTLSDMEDRLAAAGFVRVHRSVIVNLHRVVEVEPLPHGEISLRMSGGEVVIASRGHAKAVRSALGL